MENLENRKDVLVEETPPDIDFSELEKAITDLKETMDTQLELQQEEIEKKEQKDLENEEVQAEYKDLETEYQENILSIEQNQTDTLNNIFVEIQKFNEDFTSYQDYLAEHNDIQNKILVEGMLGIILALMIVPAVKAFFDQITKW